jgi:hypothetical protein
MDNPTPNRRSEPVLENMAILVRESNSLILDTDVGSTEKCRLNYTSQKNMKNNKVNECHLVGGIIELECYFAHRPTNQ